MRIPIALLTIPPLFPITQQTRIPCSRQLLLLRSISQALSTLSTRRGRWSLFGQTGFAVEVLHVQSAQLRHFQSTLIVGGGGGSYFTLVYFRFSRLLSLLYCIGERAVVGAILLYIATVFEIPFQAISAAWLLYARFLSLMGKASSSMSLTMIRLQVAARTLPSCEVPRTRLFGFLSGKRAFRRHVQRSLHLCFMCRCGDIHHHNCK